MSDAKIGAGSELRLSDGEPTTPVFTKVAEVTQVGEIGQTAPEQDATPIDATAREFIGGLREGNTVSLTLNWIGTSAQQKELRDGIGTVKDFEIAWPDNTGAEFALAINSFARGETTAEGIMTANLEGRITGPITWVDPA